LSSKVIQQQSRRKEGQKREEWIGGRKGKEKNLDTGEIKQQNLVT
jgi:hypothetical protein